MKEQGKLRLGALGAPADTFSAARFSETTFATVKAIFIKTPSLLWLDLEKQRLFSLLLISYCNRAFEKFPS